MADEPSSTAAKKSETKGKSKRNPFLGWLPSPKHSASQPNSTRVSVSSASGAHSPGPGNDAENEEPTDPDGTPVPDSRVERSSVENAPLNASASTLRGWFRQATKTDFSFREWFDKAIDKTVRAEEYIEPFTSYIPPPYDLPVKLFFVLVKAIHATRKVESELRETLENYAHRVAGILDAIDGIDVDSNEGVDAHDKVKRWIEDLNTKIGLVHDSLSKYESKDLSTMSSKAMRTLCDGIKSTMSDLPSIESARSLVLFEGLYKGQDIIMSALSNNQGAARSRSRYFPAKPVMFGREENIADIVQHLRQGHVMIVGLGGMGKTTLAKVVAHESSIRDTYRQTEQRRWVDCSIAVSGASKMKLGSAGLVIRKLLDIVFPTLQLPEQDETFESILQKLQNSLQDLELPTLIILDNFETACDADEANALQVLMALAEVDDITMLITSRRNFPFRAARPLNIVQIDSVPDLIATVIFLNVTGSKHKDDPKLKTLLSLLGGLPLAIELTADQSRLYDDIDDVLRAWDKEKTRLVQRPGVNRHEKWTSLQISLNLSIYSPAMSNEARELLFLVAAMNDLIPKTLLREQTLEAIFGRSALQNIMDNFLVSEVDLTLHILPPVKEHILTTLGCPPNHSEHLDAVRKLLLSTHIISAYEGVRSLSDFSRIWKKFHPDPLSGGFLLAHFRSHLASGQANADLPVTEVCGVDLQTVLLDPSHQLREDSPLSGDPNLNKWKTFYAFLAAHHARVIVDDAKRFVDSKTFYGPNTVPYRRGYGIESHGGGGGQDDFCKAIFAALGLEIHVISFWKGNHINTSETDISLSAKVEKCPPEAILVFDGLAVCCRQVKDREEQNHVDGDGAGVPSLSTEGLTSRGMMHILRLRKGLFFDVFYSSGGIDPLMDVVLRLNLRESRFMKFTGIEGC